METGSVSKTSGQTNWQHFKPILPPPSLKPVRYYHQNKGHNPSDRASIPSRAAQSVLLAQATSERFQPQTLRTSRLCNNLTPRLKSKPMQQIHPNHPKKSKQKWSNADMFRRTNFAKSPGIILKSQAAASWQGEMYGVIEAWLQQIFPSQMLQRIVEHHWKKLMSQYVHILTVLDKIDSNRFSQGFHLWIPFFLFAVLFGAMPLLQDVTSGPCPQWQCTASSEWVTAFLGSSQQKNHQTQKNIYIIYIIHIYIYKYNGQNQEVIRSVASSNSSTSHWIQIFGARSWVEIFRQGTHSAVRPSHWDDLRHSWNCTNLPWDFLPGNQNWNSLKSKKSRLSIFINVVFPCIINQLCCMRSVCILKLCRYFRALQSSGEPPVPHPWCLSPSAVAKVLEPMPPHRC